MPYKASRLNLHMKFFLNVKNALRKIFDLIDNERLKKNLLNALPFWVGAFLSGALAVMYAKLFAIAELGTQWLYHQASWSFLIITPVCFLFSWYLVVRFAPFAKGSGIPQVSAAIELSNPKQNNKVNALLSMRVVIVKIFSSLVMVFGGGVIGREGPTIQIAGSVFKKINDLLPDWYPKISKRNMIVTGAASGLAAAFNTPLGGIVFAIEELTKTHFSFFRSALLTGVIIAGLTALNFLGSYLYLGYPALDGITASITYIIIPLAVIAGLGGSGMGKVLLFILSRTNKLRHLYQKAIYALLCGLIIAMLGIFIDIKLFGSGKEIMATTLFSDQKTVEWYLPLLRILGSVVSFSTGAAGGIFAPSLSAGATIGAVFAQGFHLSANETNLVILCGMTGFLTGITRSPFTSSILVLEMTNTHNVIFYIMMTAVLSNLISNIVSRRSFYDNLKLNFMETLNADERKETGSEKNEGGLQNMNVNRVTR